MTPEKKFNQEIWWILQQIKKEQLATTKGGKVCFSLRILPRTSSTKREDVDYGFPQANTQRKLLYKLKEWKAFDLEPTGMYLDDPFTKPMAYILTILKKFDELYRLYKNGGSYSGKQKATTEINNSRLIIKAKCLELIAKEIGDLDSGSSLVEFLANCGVERELVEYTGTKWKMVYSILITLASSQKKEDKKTLLKIIEEACHPLMHNGDKELAKKTTDKFNNFLEYDNFFIDKGLMWQECKDPGGFVCYYDKSGNEHNTLAYMIMPNKIDKLYLYWNELIKLTKFYFENKDNQDEEINNIYFNIIKVVEETIKNGCENLKEIYKRPFRNMVGCEFEIKKQGLTQDTLFINLHDFLGEIIEQSLPDKASIKNLITDDNDFFAKINEYYKNHLPEKERVKKVRQGLPITRIEIIKIPELKVKGFQKKISEKSDKPTEKLAANITPDKYTILVKDREIWINKYLLSKPHAVGSNLEFFEYVRKQSPNTKIERNKLPDFGESCLKKDIKNKGFIKILNELGFKGEILKTFFPKRSRDMVVYIGNKIVKKDLEKAGIKMPLFLKELELAHIKNNPE